MSGPASEDCTVRDILVATSATFHIPISELTGRKRNYRISHIRHLAMAAARLHTGSSLPHIGRAFNRDHTTVMHAVAATERRMEAIVWQLRFKWLEDAIPAAIAYRREKMAASMISPLVFSARAVAEANADLCLEAGCAVA